MTFSLPSALAAATRASRPPQSVADVAVLAVDSLQEADPPPVVLPQAATTKNAITTSPSRRTGLLHFMLPSPFRPGLAPGERPICRGNIAPTLAALQGWRVPPRLISVSRPLTRFCYL